MSTQNSRGFTLIELIIILVIVGVMGAVASRVIGETIQHRRFRASLSEMELLRTAIIGDPELKSAGMRIDFGFVGDIGRFPTSLRELVVNYNLLPAWSVTTGIGWQGPYLERGFAEDPDAYRQDGWGNDYGYEPATGVITSRGSDGELGGAGYAADFSTENLAYPLDRRVGTIRGVLTDVLGNPLIDTPTTPVRVEIFAPFPPSYGHETSIEIATDAAGVFYFIADPLVNPPIPGIPAGNRSLRAIVGGIPSPLEKAVVISGAGSRHDIRVAADVTIPEAPTELRAEGIPFSHINLSWRLGIYPLPPKNTDGTILIDLAGFNIYRQTTPFTLIYPPTDANRIATVGLVRFFRDRVVRAHHRYYYIVRAFDKSGNESANSIPYPYIVNADRASTASGTDDIRKVARATTHYGEGVGAHTISVWIRRGTSPDTIVGGVRHSEDPDAPDEHLHVYYLDDGGGWVLLETFDGAGTPGAIYERTHPLPANALHTGFRLRFHQLAGDGGTLDWWHIDDVNVAGVFTDNFDDGSLGPDWTVSGVGSAGVGAHIFSSSAHSMFTRAGSVAVTSTAIDLSGLPAPPPTLGSFVTLGIRNFYHTSITVTTMRVSWMGGAPNTYSGAPGIWTRIPTPAAPVRRDDDVTLNGERAILDTPPPPPPPPPPPFTLTPYGTANSEGILYIGFDREMPEGAAITIVLNLGLAGESTFEVIW